MLWCTYSFSVVVMFTDVQAPARFGQDKPCGVRTFIRMFIRHTDVQECCLFLHRSSEYNNDLLNQNSVLLRAAGCDCDTRRGPYVLDICLLLLQMLCPRPTAFPKSSHSRHARRQRGCSATTTDNGAFLSTFPCYLLCCEPDEYAASETCAATAAT